MTPYTTAQLRNWLPPGLSAERIDCYEMGHYDISFKEIMRLSCLLGVAVEEIISRYRNREKSGPADPQHAPAP